MALDAGGLGGYVGKVLEERFLWYQDWEDQ